MNAQSFSTPLQTPNLTNLRSASCRLPSSGRYRRTQSALYYPNGMPGRVHDFFTNTDLGTSPWLLILRQFGGIALVLRYTSVEGGNITLLI